jgi:hypothetical protein
MAPASTSASSEGVNGAPRASSYSRTKAATSRTEGVSGTSSSQVTGKCAAAEPTTNASRSRDTASQS